VCVCVCVCVFEFKIIKISNICEIIPNRKIKRNLLTNNLRNSNGDGKPGIWTISDRYPWTRYNFLY